MVVSWNAGNYPNSWVVYFMGHQTKMDDLPPVIILILVGFAIVKQAFWEYPHWWKPQYVYNEYLMGICHRRIQWWDGRAPKRCHFWCERGKMITEYWMLGYHISRQTQILDNHWQSISISIISVHIRNININININQLILVVSNALIGKKKTWLQ